MANWYANTTYCLITDSSGMRTKHFHPKIISSDAYNWISHQSSYHTIIPNLSLQIIPNLPEGPEHSQLVLLVCGGLNYLWTSSVVLVLQSFKLKLKTHLFSMSMTYLKFFIVYSLYIFITQLAFIVVICIFILRCLN